MHCPSLKLKYFELHAASLHKEAVLAGSRTIFLAANNQIGYNQMIHCLNTVSCLSFYLELLVLFSSSSCGERRGSCAFRSWRWRRQNYICF